MLKIQFTTTSNAPALIIPVRRREIPPQFQAAANAGQFSGAEDETCVILGGAQRIILAALLSNPEASGANAISQLLDAQHVALDSTDLPADITAGLITGAVLRAWRAPDYRTKPDDDAVKLETLDIIANIPDAEKLWQSMAPVVGATITARNLVTEPANLLTPLVFARKIQQLAHPGLTVNIITGDDLSPFGGVCAVGQGSRNPPCVAVLMKGTAPYDIALIGKGITFDTGGICIKPADHMWDMRADMAGAAACAAAMQAIAATSTSKNIIAILPLAENTTGDKSYRPGDIIRHYDGTTVHVTDTDAEGRLVLADAMGYARAQGAATLITIATLTGSIVTALGHEYAGLFSNNEALADQLLQAGCDVGEHLWRMPVTQTDRDALDSDIADLKNCVDGSGHPDARHASAFLQEFAGDTKWAHIDIGGTELRAEATPRYPKGATGFGTRLFAQLIKNLDAADNNG